MVAQINNNNNNNNSSNYSPITIATMCSLVPYRGWAPIQANNNNNNSNNNNNMLTMAAQRRAGKRHTAPVKLQHMRKQRNMRARVSQRWSLA